MTAKDKYPWAFENEPKVEKMKCLTIKELVNEADFWLHIHSAILYGLMEGELPNADICIHYIELGKHFGVEPDKGYISPAFTLLKNDFKQLK